MFNYDNWTVLPDLTGIEPDTIPDSPLISVMPEPESSFPTRNIFQKTSVPVSPDLTQTKPEQTEGNQILFEIFLFKCNAVKCSHYLNKGLVL